MHAFPRLTVAGIFLLAGCATQGDTPIALSQAEARVALVAEKARLWKDPASIQDAKIGQPYSCIGGLYHLATPPDTCVCVEVNAKNSFGGYTGLKPSVVMFSRGKIVDTMEPRLLQDRCEGFTPFPELNGKG